MNNISNNRIYVELPSSREISFKDIKPQTNSNSPSSIEAYSGYSGFLEKFIRNGETNGFKNKIYLNKQSGSELSPNSGSYLSSFVELESESSQILSQDLQSALNEGFYVLDPENLNKNPLKRIRKTDESQQILEILLKIPENPKLPNKSIPPTIISFLKDLSAILDKNKSIEAKKIFEQISNKTGIGIERIIKCIKSEKLSQAKKQAYDSFIVSLEVCKKSVEKMRKKNIGWDSVAGKILDETEKLLELFVVANNELVSFSGKKEDFIELDGIRNAYFKQFWDAKKKSTVDVVIDVESQESERLPKSGKNFECVFEYKPCDFIVE